MNNSPQAIKPKRIRNLTGNDVIINYTNNGQDRLYNVPKEYPTPRLISKDNSVEIITVQSRENVFPIPIYCRTQTRVVNMRKLNDFDPNTYYIVTKAVATQIAEMPKYDHVNFIVSDATRAQKDENNQIVSLRSFMKITKNDYSVTDEFHTNLHAFRPNYTDTKIIKNLTSHDISIAVNNKVYTIRKEPQMTRMLPFQYETQEATIQLDARDRQPNKIVSMNIYVQGFKDIVHFPYPKKNTIYIVSKPTANFLSRYHRCDLIATDSQRANRDSHKQIVSIPAFVRLER